MIAGASNAAGRSAESTSMCPVVYRRDHEASTVARRWRRIREARIGRVVEERDALVNVL